METKPQRNYGIDALRLFSMLMIVIIHIIGHGGVEESSKGTSHLIVVVIDVFVLCAVNVYAVISGYVGYREEERKFKTSKYISLWSQVFFYSFGISLIALLFFPSFISTKSFICSIFPVITKRYWYFSSYTVVFFLAPWINKLIRTLNNVQLTKIVVLLISLFSVFSTATYNTEADPFTLNGGYSALWLIALYIVGVWLKRTSFLHSMSKLKLFILLIATWLITCGIKAVFPSQNGFIAYTSPTMVIMAVLFVVLFSKFKFNSFFNAIIKFSAPAAFGVYLIHVQPTVYDKIIHGSFSWIGNEKFYIVPFLIVGCALAIMIVCLAIEKIRIFLFKITRLDNLISYTGEKIDLLIDKIFNKKSKNTL